MDTVGTTNPTVERLAAGASEADPSATVREAPPQPPAPESTVPTALQPSETALPPVPIPQRLPPGKPNPARRWRVVIGKQLATLGIALLAVVMAMVTWDYYV